MWDLIYIDIGVLVVPVLLALPIFALVLLGRGAWELWQYGRRRGHMQHARKQRCGTYCGKQQQRAYPWQAMP